MIRSALRAGALALLLASTSALTTPAMAKPVVEVAFVLDTTGSMGPLIEGAKRKIWSIATSILEDNPDAEIRMGLVAYRDIGDDYVTKKFELTTDIQDLYANLLELRAHGGGDWPESVNEALQPASRSSPGATARRPAASCSWSATRRRTWTTRRTRNTPTSCAWRAQRDIIVNAVQAGGARDTERVWREIAQMGNGRYIPIPQDGGHLVIIETPYDRDIIELQGNINHTVIPYGPREQRSSVEQKTRQVTAAPAPAASDMASYMNTRAKIADHLGAGAEAITGRGDLVADVLNGRQPLVIREGRRTAGPGPQDEPGRAPGLHQQADGRAQDTERSAGRPGEEARPVCGRAAQQGADQDRRFLRPRGRGDPEGADQALKSSRSLRGI